MLSQPSPGLYHACIEKKKTPIKKGGSKKLKFGKPKHKGNTLGRPQKTRKTGRAPQLENYTRAKRSTDRTLALHKITIRLSITRALRAARVTAVYLYMAFSRFLEAA